MVVQAGLIIAKNVDIRPVDKYGDKAVISVCKSCELTFCVPFGNISVYKLSIYLDNFCISFHVKRNLNQTQLIWFHVKQKNQILNCQTNSLQV